MFAPSPSRRWFGVFAVALALGASSRAAVAQESKCRPPAASERFTFEFEGDVQQLVDLIAKRLCRNFILTDKVRGQKFEIVASEAISADDLWRAFLSALEANDLSVVRVGAYYKLIQATEGTRSPVSIHDDTGPVPTDDRMITVLWRPKHATDLGAVINYLNIFKSNQGQIHGFQSTGLIVATDYGTSIERLRTILDEIDEPGTLEHVHIVPAAYATATELAEKLTQILEPKPGEGIAKILADDRTNKLLVIASKSGFARVRSMMLELDVPAEATSDEQINVLRLKHADAEELSSTLSSLAQGGNTAAAPPRGVPGTPAALTKPTGGAAASGLQGEVKITADKATNSLLVTTSKSNFTAIQRIVERLDVPRLQVFVEVVILEVSMKRDRRLGVGWHAGIAPTIGDEQSPIVFANTPNSELSSLLAAANPLGLASLLGFAGAVSGPTLPGTDTIVSGGIPAIGVVVQALQSTNDVNIVSTPHLLTLDNEEAEIQVNEKRPFPSGLTLGGLGGLGGLAGAAGGLGGAAGQGLGGLGGLGLGSLSFNREDVGLTLKLKPQINDEDNVRLEIDQELSDVAGIDQVTGQTITSKRAAKTVVVVRSQDSVVIGGLVRDRETTDESKTPLLGDLPLLGWLFKRQARVVEKVNLMLVITPYIVRSPHDFRQIFERKMEERKEFVDRFYGTNAEFRATIDWNRKVGPLGGYRQRMRQELQKAENEGPGEKGETVIQSEEAP